MLVSGSEGCVGIQRCREPFPRRVLSARSPPIDGKVLQRSFDDATARSPVHLMFVFAAQARLTLGQVRANGMSIETAAMPALPNPHNFKGSVVTAGAMHAQRPAAETVAFCR